jgi:asparagine synthase (glutamine-hydrolysing)
MCGIVAVFDCNSKKISVESLRAATLAMEHRGPDGQNTWLDVPGYVGFGHTRLSIIDLQGGAQPLQIHASGTAAVVNGEFYDFERIRKELQNSGAQFQTSSDSEILLHLWEKYGTECVHHLRGEFSFALWDARKECLFVGRDRFGIKPLYFAHHQNRWHFASEVKALKALGVPVAFDDLNVQLAMTFGLTENQTLFQGISQIAPGHVMMIHKDQFFTRKYWDFNFPKQGNHLNVPFEEAKEELHRLLMESVSLRLRADVPVGIYLSGGLDSSVLAGMAAQQGYKPRNAYTVSFEDSAFDEFELAQETAKRLGISHSVIKVTDTAVADHFFAAIAKCEGILENPAPIAKYLLSKHAHLNGERVVLTGEGSDEIFGGYPHFRQDMYLHNQQGQLPQDLAAFEDLLTKSNSTMAGGLLGDFKSPSLPEFDSLLGFTPMIYKTFGKVYEILFSLFRKDPHLLAKKDQLSRIHLSSFDIQNQLAKRDPMHISMYMWSKTFLNNRLLRSYGDGMEMSHSLEGRVPFLDHVLVEFVSQLPVHFKAKGVVDKFILREAGKPYITPSIYGRQKHPFSAPPASGIHEGKLKQLILDSLHSSQIQKISAVDPDVCKSLAKTLKTGSPQETIPLEGIALRVTSLCAIQETIVG